VPRAALVDALAARLPDLDWNGHRPLCESEDDALDAVLAALIAREVAQGRAVPPREEELELARQEGWIWLPRSTSPGAGAGAGTSGRARSGARVSPRRRRRGRGRRARRPPRADAARPAARAGTRTCPRRRRGSGPCPRRDRRRD